MTGVKNNVDGSSMINNSDIENGDGGKTGSLNDNDSDGGMKVAGDVENGTSV